MAQANLVGNLRRLRFTLVFTNQTPFSLLNQIFWCYLPANTLHTQKVISVDVSMQFQIHTDILEQKILELRFSEFSPYSKKIVTFTATVECFDKLHKIQLEHIENWLVPERFIEVENQRIKDLSIKLKKSNQAETAYAIFEWVRNNIEYAGYIPEDLGALQALNTLRGDCTEYASLVVALARANHLPARMIGGYVIENDSSPRPEDYHNWAEIYFDGTWQLVDSQKNTWLRSNKEYIIFRVHSNKITNPIGNNHRYFLKGEVKVSF